MGKPVARAGERFEKIAIDGITVWKSSTVSPAQPARPILVDLGGWLLFGKRVLVKNAR
jgi:hypothetical protein